MRVQTIAAPVLACALAGLAIGCAGDDMEGEDGGPRADAARDAAMDDGSIDDAGSQDDAATDAGGAPGRAPRLYVGRVDGELAAYAIGGDGSIAETSRTRTGHYPSFAAIAPDGRSLYVVNEGAAEVVSLAIEPGTGRTALRNSRPSGGGAPTHVSLDRAGRFVFVANYGGGTVRVFPIDGDGSLGAPVDTESPGANAHAIEVDRSNRWVLVPCKGDDLVAILALDPASGALERRATHRTARGAGPRHLAFDADGDRVYLVNENDSTIDVLGFDATAGTLAHLQTVSALPAGFSGSSTTAEIAIGPDGRFVYASNRGHDSIAIFEIVSDGRLAARGHAMLGARTPRSFAITPDGSRLYAGALESDEIVRFAIAGDGSLAREGATGVSAGPWFVGVFAIADE